MPPPEDKAREQIDKVMEKCIWKVQDTKSVNLHAFREVALRHSLFVERHLSVIDELEAAVEANLIRADRLRQAILQRAFSDRLLNEKGHAGSSNSSMPLLAAESVSPYGVRS